MRFLEHCFWQLRFWIAGLIGLGEKLSVVWSQSDQLLQDLDPLGLAELVVAEAGEPPEQVGEPLGLVAASLHPVHKLAPGLFPLPFSDE